MQAHGDRYIKEEEEHNRKEKGNVNDWLLSGKKKKSILKIKKREVC